MALSLHNAKGVQGIGDQAEVQYKTAGAGGVTSGDWVALAGPTTVVPSDDGDPTTLVSIGVALDTATPGLPVRVCTAGPCTAAVTTGVAVGAAITTGTVAGRAIVWDNSGAASPDGDGGICGICTGTPSANVATVYVVRRLY